MSAFGLHILARPTFDEGAANHFLKSRNLAWAESPLARAGERLIEFAGRLCYMSFTDDTSKIRHPNSAYIDHLIQSGHESVLEHISWTFLLTGVSRAFTHQLVRHRVGWAYSQLSQQYYDHSDLEVVEPDGLDDEERRAWAQEMAEVQAFYRRLASKDGPRDLPQREALRARRSAARGILPEATATAIVATANARALRHFFAVRGTIEGDFEMRKVASALLAAVAEDAPSVFNDFAVETHADGKAIVVGPN